MVITFFKNAKSNKKLSSTSQKTIFAPAFSTLEPVAINVCTGTTTSSVADRRSVASAISNAAVQEFVATAYSVAQYVANSSSNFATFSIKY